MQEMLLPRSVYEDRDRDKGGSRSTHESESRELASPFRPLASPYIQPTLDTPVAGDFRYSELVIGGGVAIFHLASARVVLCRHSVFNAWFLPKGRRDAGEESIAGAEREGFEESGYRNRVLPIPLRHRQPRPHNPASENVTRYSTEPIWTQFMPQTRTIQYILFWYVAETVPPKVEKDLNEAMTAQSTTENPTPYQYPPRYPLDLSLEERIKLEPEGYEPVHHPNTGVNSEEALYESHLVPIEEACRRLKGTVMEDVVRQGWEAICLRHTSESTSR